MLCVIFTAVDNRYLYAINTSARISKYRKQLRVESCAFRTWEFITKIVTRLNSPNFVEEKETVSILYPKSKHLYNNLELVSYSQDLPLNHVLYMV